MTAILDVATNIRVLPVMEDANPMHPVCTNIYFIGDRELTLIDTGVDADRFSRALFSGLLSLGPGYHVAAAALTHSHWDHGGGLRWLRESIGPEVYAHPGALDVVRKKLGETPVHAFEEYGSVLEADGVQLEVHWTPGHNDDSVCYFERPSRILFTGDTILGKGTTTIHDLGSYLKSLEHLVSLRSAVICPGHGPLIHDPESVLREYIQHRQQREGQILEQLSHGPRSITQLVNRLYGDIHPRLKRAARGNVRQHLLKLQSEGRATSEGAGATTKYRLMS